MRDMNIKTHLDLKNDFQLADYGEKTDPNPKAYSLDFTYNNIENVNWESESKYHNTYYINGKYNLGRTIIKKK